MHDLQDDFFFVVGCDCTAHAEVVVTANRRKTDASADVSHVVVRVRAAECHCRARGRPRSTAGVRTKGHVFIGVRVVLVVETLTDHRHGEDFNADIDNEYSYKKGVWCAKTTWAYWRQALMVEFVNNR